ncbi:MAG: carbohydrate binding domain-containing protein [Candidatus Sumerlaeota bacterium]|nr:carbohydrate binding domain-containing protein [Candidatus Sumerlaeota bacterium]
MKSIGVLVASAAWLTCALLPAAETIVNEDFEGPFAAFPRQQGRKGAFECAGALPKGWEDNSKWGDAHVKYGVSPDAHGGKQGLRIETLRLGGNASSELVVRNIPLRKGLIYAISLAARSDDSSAFDVSLRSQGNHSTKYVTQAISPGTEWAVFEVEGAVDQDDPSALLSLRFPHVGVVDIDDVRVEASPADEFAKSHPAHSGNLLETTRFPLGSANGWSLPRGDSFLFEPEPKEIGPSGAPALRLGEPSSHGSLGDPKTGRLSLLPTGALISTPMQLRPGQSYTASFWAKAAEPDASMQATLCLWKDRERDVLANATFAPSGEWQRFSLTGKAPVSDKTAYLVFTHSNTVLLDGAQVEEGDQATPYSTQRPVEVCAVPAVDYGIFFEGQPLEFKVAATGQWEKGASIKARIVDLFDRKRDLPPIALTQSPFETRISVPLEEILIGSFRLELQAVDAQGKAVSPYGEALAMRILKPRFPDEDRPDSPFGIHINANGKQARMAQALGFKWIRCHDAAQDITKWFFVEAAKGKWKWQDAKADVFRAHHLMILGTLDTSPNWAGGLRHIPTDMDAWSQYCRETVAHYKGKINDWEIWNEPYYTRFYITLNGKDVKGAPQDFLEVAKRAYTAAKESNPNCTILPSAGPVATWTAGCVRAGVFQYADMLTHHQYTTQLPGGPDDTIAASYNRWRKELPKELKSMPSWDTEGGISHQSQTFYSHLPVGSATKRVRFYADLVARYYISALSLGVPKFFLYSFHGHAGLGNPNAMLVNGDGTLLPLATAVSALAWHIEGKHFVRRDALGKTAWAYLFTDGQTSVAAIVQAPGKTYELEKIEGAECRDLCGNVIALPATVGPETCYLASKGGADALAKALKAK